MDAFTENILARARERKKILEGYGGERSERTTPSKTRVSSDLPGSPQSHLKTLNIQKDNFNMEIKVSSTENVRVEVEIEEQDSDAGSQISDNGLRDDTKSKLKRLAKLYTGGDEADISSPIHRTEDKFYNGVLETQSTNQNRKGLSKLAELAKDMDQWEDDLKHHNIKAKNTTPKKVKKFAPQPPTAKVSPSRTQTKPKAPQPPIKLQDDNEKSNQNSNSSPVKKQSCANIVGATPKKLHWDQKVLDSLESQGFTRTTSSSGLVYSYNSQEQKKTEETASQEVKEELKPSPVKACPKSPSKVQQRTAAIASKAALFESPSSSPAKGAKDPALLSVSERKALFEKNKGEALLPKAAFGMAVPVKEKPKEVKNAVRKVEKENAKPLEKPSTVGVGAQAGIASKVAALLEGKATISQEQIESSVKEQRQKEMDVLLNRFNRNKEVVDAIVHEEDEESEGEDDNEQTAMLKEKKVKIVSKGVEVPPPPPPPVGLGEKRKSDQSKYGENVSPNVVAALTDVKRIKVSPPKAGRLYPNLSDIEATTETETDQGTRTPSPNNSSFENNASESDEANTSFGREILQAVCKNQGPYKRPVYDESTASDISSALDDDMDEFLDEALGEIDGESSGPTPPKQGRHYGNSKSATQPSDSFHYKSYSPNIKNQFKSPVKIITSPKKMAETPTVVVDGDNVMPLTHTVSFYRRQQLQHSNTPVKQVIRRVIEEDEPREKTDDSRLVEEKIKELTEEVNKQQMTISQTSQALNLCNCTPEFSGSTEQVEAERVLLIATHRRQAAVNELQRLRVEGTLQPQGEHCQNLPLEKGTLTISDIVLPLKKKYVTALAATGGKGHHVICLIKCGDQVIPSKLTSTVASSSKNPDVELKVPGSITLKNIFSHFTVTFEVYCLQAQEECLPHEVKYHINNKKGLSSKLTPKKLKNDSRLARPIKESPAGPQAVRSPSFALMGYVVFSVQAVNKRLWTLNNTPSMSPLEGSVEMRISCELAVSVEHKGFLTMFEDVSGFGAWHRRWYLLKGHCLSFWKYPDDERTKPPIDTIDLKNCITKNVGPVSREICARLHTFLLERERMAYPQDTDTLVMVRKGEKTVIRHLLSADSKEERIEWCSKLNAALTAIRMWGNSQ